MTNTLTRQETTRWLYLAFSVVLLMCLGLIYAWSVFRVPLEQDFGWAKAETSLTFSISMMMFCLGGVVSGIVTAKRGVATTLVACAVCLGAGFGGASQVHSLLGIYVTYGALCGLGVGLGYNATISTAVKWFPDKTGLVSGISLMGFGVGAMVLGTVAASLIESIGWRMTFGGIGLVFGILMLVGALVLRPASPAFIQHMTHGSSAKTQTVEDLSFHTMLRRRNFWLYFAWAALLSAAGLAVINISTAYAGEFVGHNLTEAAALAGIVSIANGVGRVVFGQLFDSKGYKVTMVVITTACFLAGSAFIAADMSRSLPVLVAAFVLIGLMYGGVTPTNSAFTAYFFGRTHYALNFSITNLNLIIASYVGPLCASGEPFFAFVLFLALAVAAFILLCCIRRPSM